MSCLLVQMSNLQHGRFRAVVFPSRPSPARLQHATHNVLIDKRTLRLGICHYHAALMWEKANSHIWSVLTNLRNARHEALLIKDKGLSFKSSSTSK